MSKQVTVNNMAISELVTISKLLKSKTEPVETLDSIVKYANANLYSLGIAFLYRQSYEGSFLFIGCNHHKTFDINSFPSVKSSFALGKMGVLSQQEKAALGEENSKNRCFFPLIDSDFHFGCLFFNEIGADTIAADSQLLHLEMLVQMVSNYCCQAYLLKLEKQSQMRMNVLIKDLVASDKKLQFMQSLCLKLQKTEILTEITPVIFHKLKNKLTPVLGYAQILLLKIKDEAILDKVTKIESNASQLTDQLNLLKNHFKTDLPQTLLENINHIVNHLADYFSQLEKKHAIKIVRRLDETIPFTNLIPGQIELLIENLVDNAVSAIKSKGNQDGCIQIITHNQPDTIILSIIDNGIGILPEHQDKIWSPFVSCFSGQDEHPGIGLTICEKILNNHQADFKIESIPNEKTEFSMHFKKNNLQTNGQPTANSISPPLFTKHIAIIESEENVSILMKEILITEGFQHISIFTDLSLFQQSLTSEKYDALILAQTIQLSDLEVLSESMSAAGDKPVPLIIITRDPHFYSDIKNLKDKNIEILSKPFELTQFKRLIVEKLS